MIFITWELRKLSRSAHQTSNFKNPKFKFPQFKVLQSFFYFFVCKEFCCCCLTYFGLTYLIQNFYLANTNKVSKQKFVAKIRDSYWLFTWSIFGLAQKKMVQPKIFWLQRIIVYAYPDRKWWQHLNRKRMWWQLICSKRMPRPR